MPPPLPVPSKAAIHALRGIALGTSCAIGVILEDRRRRINTLRTAISNKEKLKSARRYHGMADAVALQLEDAILVGGDEMHWHQLDDRARRHVEYNTPEGSSRHSPVNSTALSLEPAPSSGSEDISESCSSPATAQTESSSPTPTQQNTAQPPDNIPLPPMFPQTMTDISLVNVHGSWPKGSPPPPTLGPDKDKFIQAITNILASKDEERLDRAMNKFFEGCSLFFPSKKFDEEWISVSIQLSKACQVESRWDDAGKVLATTVSAGPLDETLFYAHEPLPIIEFYLRQVDEHGRCSLEHIAAATHLFLPTFKEKPQLHGDEIENIGKQLLTQNLMFNEASVFHAIYWRTLGLLKEPVAFVAWAIQKLYEYNDHKNVVKLFLLNYSKMSPGARCYRTTIEYVVNSVESLEGLKANLVLKALHKMNRPNNVHLRTRWIFKLLQAYWRRNEDFPMVKALFEEVLSWGLLDIVRNPKGVYRAMIEIAVKAGEDDMIRSYYEVLIQKCPDMKSDVALRGSIALAIARTGDWDGVVETLMEMQALRSGREKEYDNAFVMILKIYAETHPVAEVRDFVSRYVTDLGMHIHPYIVSIVANKYGACHDTSGFIAWLEYCSEAGFALDSKLCNAVLHNCRTNYNYPYFELQELHSKIRHLSPSLIDNVTQRIMSQAALTAGKCVKPSIISRGVHSKAIIVNKLAYTGRTTNQRDIYEAMNQELNCGRPVTAISIYKRALGFGMRACRHCLRLAVVAALKSPENGTTTAMTLIRKAHEKGDDVSSAVSMFIRLQLDRIHADAEEMLIHMRNIVSRFEALQIIIEPSVLTHMAMISIRLGHYERAIVLCTLAMNQNGFGNLCFSRQSIKVLLIAYSKLLDLEEMKKLVQTLFTSDYSTDTAVFLYLKSTKKMVAKFERNATVETLLGILNDAIAGVVKRRAENRREGSMIAEETLHIMQRALEDMEGHGEPTAVAKPVGHEAQLHLVEASDNLPLVVASG
ncbi:hypothetical protein F4804DRAFT_304812 [Jackrogersella minutella]|nr:hypothetical protein F4804DRAFT_304812 [Jackrogersella minutella]